MLSVAGIKMFFKPDGNGSSMETILIPFIIGVALSLVTVLADSLVKHAALQDGMSGWQPLLGGALIYGITAFGWFFVLRRLKALNRRCALCSELCCLLSIGQCHPFQGEDIII